MDSPTPTSRERTPRREEAPKWCSSREPNAQQQWAHENERSSSGGSLRAVAGYALWLSHLAGTLESARQASEGMKMRLADDCGAPEGSRTVKRRPTPGVPDFLEKLTSELRARGMDAGSIEWYARYWASRQFPAQDMPCPFCFVAGKAGILIAVPPDPARQRFQCRACGSEIGISWRRSRRRQQRRARLAHLGPSLRPYTP